MLKMLDICDAPPLPKAWDFLVYPWLQPGRLTLMVGAADAGKTTLTLEMIAACMNRRHFLGRYPTRPIKHVLYLHGEHTPETIMDANQMRGDIPRDSVKIIQDFGGYSSCMIQDGRPNLALLNEITQACNLLKPELIIAEPIPAFLGASENDNKEVRTLIQILCSFATKYKAAVLTHHHFGKVEFDPEHQRMAGVPTGGARGAMAFEDAAERVIYLKYADAKEPTHLKLETPKPKGYPVSTIHLRRDVDKLTFAPYASDIYTPDMVGLYAYIRDHKMPKAVAIPKLASLWRCTTQNLEHLYKRCERVSLLNADGTVIESPHPKIETPELERKEKCPILSTL